MDEAVARVLLQSLLSRIRGDDVPPSAPFRGLVSADELRALELLVDARARPAEGAAASGVGDSSSDADTTPLAATPEQPVTDRSASPSVLVPQRVELDRAALRQKAPDNPSITLCLDFGTARSKAFAAEAPGGGVGKLFDLAVGKEAGESGSVYSVTSSVWIDQNGQVFVGEEAVRRSLLDLESGATRQRLDSLKQEISQIPGVAAVERRQLPRSVNPTAVPLTVEDAITLYLAYLTDIAGGALSTQHGAPRYIRRRFALPCWDTSHRLWAAEVLGNCLRRAILLADTLRGRWLEGIPAELAKELLTAAAAHDEEVSIPRQSRGL